MRKAGTEMRWGVTGHYHLAPCGENTLRIVVNGWLEVRILHKAELAKGYIHSEGVDWEKKIYPQAQSDVKEVCNLYLDSG